MKFILMGLIKRFTKEAGRSPNPGELTNLKKMAKDMESSEKVIPFPESRITDPFKPRPKSETEAEMLARMKRQNKESVERLKKKKEKDLGDKLKDFDGDPDAMAGGGIAGFAGDQRVMLAKGGGLKALGKRIMNEPGFKETLAGELGLEGLLQIYKLLGMPIGLKDGGPPDPSRRTFMKILGGLASIPVLGKFVKPAVKVAENPEVARRVTQVPAYFLKLVDKIKRLGDDAPGLTDTERQIGKQYKDYELVEDLSSGDIVVKKTRQGAMTVGDDVVEGVKDEQVMAYRSKKSTEDGILPEDYQEVTVRPDYEGKLKDVDDGLESIEDILREVGEDSIKRAGGGLAYMLGQ